VNNQTYVGSSKDLGRRLRDYFNINYLARNETMYICRSLLLHGYSNFSLEILEYCDSSLLLEREKWYFELFQPEYNLAEEPGSPMLGRTHSAETKARGGGSKFFSKKKRKRAQRAPLAALTPALFFGGAPPSPPFHRGAGRSPTDEKDLSGSRPNK
jgi:group I intron endonuclease